MPWVLLSGLHPRSTLGTSVPRRNYRLSATSRKASTVAGCPPNNCFPALAHGKGRNCLPERSQKMHNSAAISNNNPSNVV
jgi:hypothetical protein